MLRTFEALYGAPEGSAKGEVYGLNHLSYFRSVTVNGREVLDELIENDRAYEETDLRYFEKRLLRERHAILNEYLYYFYYREKAVENILRAPQTRGEQIADVNRRMTGREAQYEVALRSARQGRRRLRGRRAAVYGDRQGRQSRFHDPLRAEQQRDRRSS